MLNIKHVTSGFFIIRTSPLVEFLSAALRMWLVIWDTLIVMIEKHDTTITSQKSARSRMTRNRNMCSVSRKMFLQLKFERSQIPMHVLHPFTLIPSIPN